MAKKKRDFVGIYITPHRIEAAYFADEDSNKLTAQGHIEIPEGVFDDEGDIADTAQLADLLKELWDEAGFKVWKAVVVLASRKAIVRQVKLPHMPEHALQQTVLSEAEQFALFRKEEPLVHFFVSDPEGEFMSVCFGAISSEVVKQYNEVCKLAGIKLQSVDLVQLAGQRGIAYWYPPEEDYWTGVMVLQQRLIVSFWKESRLQNIREILLPDRETISMDLLAQNYIPEITRTISGDSDFFEDPHLIVGCDNLDSAKALASNIQTFFNFPAKVAGPVEFGYEGGAKPRSREEGDEEDDEDGDDEAPLEFEISYITVGAALWGDKGAVPSFNLTKFATRSAMSGPFKAEHIQHLLKNVPILPLVGAFVAVLGTVGGLYFWSTVLQRQAAELQQKLADLQNQTQAAQAKAEKIQPDQAVMDQWLGHSAEHEFAEGFVGKLRDIVPSDTWIYSIEYRQGQEISIHGASIHQDSPLKFADELSNLPDIANPRVRNLVSVGPFFKFEIHASLVDQGVTTPGVSSL